MPESDTGDISQAPPLVKQKFIRKVYFIITVQLVCVIALMVFTYATQNFRDIVYYNPSFAVTLFIIITFSILLFMCIPEMGYIPRYKYVSLITFTILLMYASVVIISYFHYIEIIICFGVTCLNCLALTLVTFVPEYTLNYIIQYTALITLNTVIFIVMSFIYPFSWFYMIICYIICLTIACYLLLQEQSLMRGTHHHVYTENDYTVSVLDVYLAIFFYIIVGVVKIVIIIASVFKTNKTGK